ncbi:hypothetical protein [Modestobacter altitudinis]|uniref:hypothetical protein n=1 Tax=Modestobacter altitudinis TaxID=2213158 RepID=UPI00110C9EBF|nr:hypothetical protein [Modestobacter altitudinis]
MSHLISVQLDVLGGLLAELRAMGVELSGEQQLTAASGQALGRALPGPVGEEAALAGDEWAGALGALAARTLAVAATLDAALAAYRRADLQLARQLVPARPGSPAVPR